MANRTLTIADQRTQLRAARLSHAQIALEAEVGTDDVQRADRAWRLFAPRAWADLLIAQEKAAP